MTNKIIIETKELAIGYSKQKPIVNSINMSISQGALVGLIGRNGTGKSTFIKTLSRLIDPVSGVIWIEDKELSSYPQKQFSKLVSILLSQQSIPGFTKVYDLISLGRYPHTNYFGKLTDKDIQAIDRAMEMMNIDHLKNKMAISLSDGEKQKVMLARALAQDTPILILDEPTTFLDLPSKLSFFKHLKTINEEMSKTILIASHEWSLLSEYGNDFIVFNESHAKQKTSIAHELSEI